MEVEDLIPSWDMGEMNGERLEKWVKGSHEFQCRAHADFHRLGKQNSMDLAITPSDLSLPSAFQMCHTQAQGGGRESSLQECHEFHVLSLTGVSEYKEPRLLRYLSGYDKRQF